MVRSINDKVCMYHCKFVTGVYLLHLRVLNYVHMYCIEPHTILFVQHYMQYCLYSTTCNTVCIALRTCNTVCIALHAILFVQHYIQYCLYSTTCNTVCIALHAILFVQHYIQYCLYSTACNTVCIALHAICIAPHAICTVQHCMQYVQHVFLNWYKTDSLSLNNPPLINLCSTEPVPNYVSVCLHKHTYCVNQLCGSPSSELFVVQRRRPAIASDLRFDQLYCTETARDAWPNMGGATSAGPIHFNVLHSQRPNWLLPCWALINCFWDNVTHVLHVVCIVAL